MGPILGGGCDLQWHRRGAAGAASSPASPWHGPAAPTRVTRLRPLSQRGSASTPRLRGRPPGDSPGGRRVLGSRFSRRAGGWRLEPLAGVGVGALGGGGGPGPSPGGVTGRSGSGGVAAGWRPAAQGDRRRWPQWPARRPPQHRPAVSTLAVRMDCDDHCVPSLCQHCGSAALYPPAGPRAVPAEWCWDGGRLRELRRCCGTGAAG